MVKKVYVGNLPSDTTQESLEAAFAEFGVIDSVNLIKDRDTGQNKGFAFVEMANETDAESAIHELDGTMMGTCEIKVNEAKPMRQAGGASHRDRS